MKQILNVFIFFITLGIYAQALPPIQNFSPKEYGAENQNWAISQAEDKIIYIANNRGLLEFNGAEWQLYPSPNTSVMRSVNVVGSKIYTGCFREFGYWEKNEFGKLIYTSLSNKLEKEIIDYEYFWNIIDYDNWILFQSLHNIYIFNNEDHSFTIIPSETQLPKMFKVGNAIYFQKLDDGLYKIENGKAVLVSNDIVFQQNILVDIFLSDKEIRCLTQNNGFYILKGNKAIKKNILADKELNSLSVYSSLRLNDNSIALGTIANGVYLLNEFGEIIRIVKQENGINNNTILSLFEDVDKNIWLGLDNGISVVNVQSPYREFSDLNGNIGAVYASKLFNNYLYVGTNQGLYYKKHNSNDELKFIDGTAGQVWNLKIVDDTLFCGHNNGTYIVKEGRVTQISDVVGTWDIQEVENNPNLLIQGHYNGLNVLEKINGKWKLRNQINGFEISCRHFVFSKTNEILVNHEFEGLYKIKLDDDFKNVIEFSVKRSASKGVNSSLAKFENTIYYASEEGLFKFNSNTDEFEKELAVSTILLDNDTYFSGQIAINKKERKMWMFTSNNIICFESGKLDNVLRPNKISMPADLRGFMAGYENVLSLSGNEFMFGGSNGYLILDLNELEVGKKDSYEINIYNVEKSILDGEPSRVSLLGEVPFHANENNISFKYFVPEFEKYKKVHYRYRLKGFYDNWSGWSSNANTYFKNLPFGTYKFEVQAKIGNSIIEKTAFYNFKIERPWFISNLMLILYTILFFTTIGVIHIMYKRNFNKQKEQLIEKNKREFELNQLENEKVIMQLQNEKLQQDIDGKTKELSASAMSIIKKNELLTQIKNELLAVGDKKTVQPVVKIINKNLVNNQDWELFQDAFNNADSDFLKHIKEIHPKLTPNDLKLCAYLRLNLSSKEIAPLLNISPRSVEIKRYRLRKKMELAHEKSLVEYILEM